MGNHPCLQQAQDNLGLGSFAVLGEVRGQQGILPCSLEVKGGDIIEHDAYFAAKYPARVLHTDLLNPLSEGFIQLVHETVDDTDVYLLAPISSQIIGGRQLAPGAAETGHDKVTEHLAAQVTKTDAIIDAVKYKMGPILNNGLNA